MGFVGAGSHGREVRGRQFAGKGFDHHIRRLYRRPVLAPVTNLHALLVLAFRLGIGLWAQGRKNRRLIHPEAHRLVVFGHQLASQAPGHADVAKVIDDVAEDVPLHDADSRRKPQFTQAPGTQTKCPP
ncbi:hypothetical protein D9M72_370780 [compost metagenome]